MTERTLATVQLSRVEKKLSSWRERHGGRGRPIPNELWAEAADVAAVAGVSETARVLGVDRERLARRVGERGACVVEVSRQTGLARAAFVEVDAQRVFARGRAVVRLSNREGEQLEVEMEGGALEVAAVARALWGQAR